MKYGYWKVRLATLATLADKNKAVAIALVDVRNAAAARAELYQSVLKPKFREVKAVVSALGKRRAES
jgi:hypothetical protein